MVWNLLCTQNWSLFIIDLCDSVVMFITERIKFSKATSWKICIAFHCNLGDCSKRCINPRYSICAHVCMACKCRFVMVNCSFLSFLSSISLLIIQFYGVVIWILFLLYYLMHTWWPYFTSFTNHMLAYSL